MSRSKYKSSNQFGVFLAVVCYFSNKKSKRFCNQKFRCKSKRQLKRLMQQDDYENENFIYKPREVMDTWDFSSDGLKYYLKLHRSRKYPYTRIVLGHRPMEWNNIITDEDYARLVMK